MSVLIVLHATAASLSLLLGAAVLLRQVKGDRAHRLTGRCWVVAMYATLATSMFIQRLNPGHFTVFHALSLFTFVTLTLGLWAGRTHRLPIHIGNMIGSYCGLLGAFIGAVAVPERDVPQLAAHHPVTFTACALGLLLVAAAIVGACLWVAGRLPRRGSGGADDQPANGPRHDHDITATATGR